MSSTNPASAHAAEELARTLRERLAALSPLRVELTDDSAKHAGHAGARGGAHYRLTIVSPRFSGQTLLARHRLVYAALGELLHGQVHALGIEALAPEEVQ